MAFDITKELIMLCEGPADRNFLHQLLKNRGLNDFDLPPHEHMGKHYGWEGFGFSLKALAGDPSSYRRLKGVLVVADSRDDPAETFDIICQRLNSDGPFKQIGPFVRPTRPNVIAKQLDGHPCISIMLMPIGGAGALETVCGASILQDKPWLANCVEKFLGCGHINALNWGAEKRDKARIQCMIAALNETDPNKGLNYLLESKSNFFDFSSEVFTPVVDLIKMFQAGVSALGS